MLLIAYVKNLYDIAVVGESMAGKSTWISNLFEEDITKKLKSICDLNQEGQTKIPVHYRLVNPSKKVLNIKSVGWNLEVLAKTLKEKANHKYVQAFGLDGVRIRDTRGFLDETEDKM